MANSAEIAKAYVQIIPTTKGIGGSLSNLLDDEGEKSGKNSGASFGNMFIKTASKIVATLGIAKLFSEAITSGGEVEQSFGGLETMFKESYDKVVSYANDAWKTTGLSANAYAEQITSFSASLLQSLNGDTDKAVESANLAMQDMADNANKFGTDISSIQNAYQGFAKQNYTMLDNLKLGYGGTKTEMERLLKDAQKLTGIKYDINSLDDVYSAIHVIQEELGVTGTTALEASSTLQGSANEIKASWENLLGAVTGTTDALDITEAVEGLTTGITDYASNLIPVLVSIVETLPTALIDTIDTLLPLMMDEAPKLIDSLVTGIANNLPRIIESGVNMIAKLVVGIANNLPMIVEWASKIVSALWDGISKIDWMTLGKNIVQGLVNGITSVGSLIKDKLMSLAQNAYKSIKSFFGIKSPSKLMANEIGKYIPLGMAVGIEANADSVVDAMDDISQMTMASAETGIISPLGRYDTNSTLGTTNVGGVSINVYGAEGQNIKELAEEVNEILMNEINKNRMVYA